MTTLPVIGGGAVRSADHARELGADGYAADPAAATAVVARLIGQEPDRADS